MSTTHVFEAIKMRRSVRSYSSKQIPEDILNKVLSAMRYAPSACNIQPWKFVIVTRQDTKEKLISACHGQRFIAEPPVVVVACGFPSKAYRRMGGSGNSAEIDVTIALDHLTLAAVEEGLGTCWIGAFSEPEVKRILGIPDSVKVVAIIPLGYPKDGASAFHPVDESDRKPLSEIICCDKWA
jgi:nitroreductase